MLAFSGEEIYHFCFVFTLYSRENFKDKLPRVRLYSEGRFNGGFFLRYDLEGLYLEGLVHGGAYFRNFTVYFHVRVKLGVRKRKLSQVRLVSELMNEKLGHRVAMTTALVTITLILSF